MGGQKFEYDESGATYFYFVLSFLALILVPATFYYWPRKRKEGNFLDIIIKNYLYIYLFNNPRYILCEVLEKTVFC